jgi:hypothetical protein
MVNRPYFAATLIAVSSLLTATPASADGEVLITHAKALAGNATPGDPAGYPVTLSIPGKFQLASNLFVAANKIGIHVTHKNVTIDLNGFTLEGSDVAFHGIVGGVDAVTIENGTITQFRFDGIHGTGDYWIADNLRSIENGRDGMVVGQFAIIKSSIVVANGDSGITTGASSVIQGNTVSNHNAAGIVTLRSSVIGNTVTANLIGLDGGVNPATSGYSANTFADNTAVEAADVLPQHPNACVGPCP